MAARPSEFRQYTGGGGEVQQGCVAVAIVVVREGVTPGFLQTQTRIILMNREKGAARR